MKHLYVLLLIFCSFNLFGQINLVREFEYPYTQFPGHFIPFNGHLYYEGPQGIYRTDGTTHGTTLVGEGLFDFYTVGHCISGGHLYFNNLYRGLYRINGITGELEKIKELWTPRYMMDLNGILLFTENGENLWRSDGTEESTYKLINGNAYYLNSDGTYAYFGQNINLGMTVIWRTDGTVEGTQEFFDWRWTAENENTNNPGSGTYIYNITTWQDNVFIFGTYRRKWKDSESQYWLHEQAFNKIYKVSNGSLSEIYNDQILNYNGITNTGWSKNDLFFGMTRPYKTNDNLYFFTYTIYEYPYPLGNNSKIDQLWKINNNFDTVSKVAQLGNETVTIPQSFATSMDMEYPYNSTNLFYFVAKHDDYGTELWRSDGTDEGTFMVKDINPGEASSIPQELNIIGDICYFLADDGVHGFEVWSSDGTEEGTYMVMDLNEGVGDGIGGNYNINIWDTRYDPYLRGYHGYQFGRSFNDRYYFPGFDGQLYATGGNPPPSKNSLYFNTFDYFTDVYLMIPPKTGQ